MKNTLHALTNQNLLTELKALVKNECEVLGQIIRYLQEVEVRALHLELGYSSLFSFCTQLLGYSESAACRRIQAARSSIETPVLLTKLEAGTLTLCAVGELSRVAATVREQLIPQSEGKPKEAVKLLVAQHLPPQVAKSERVTVHRVKPVEESALPLFSAASVPAPPDESPQPIRYTVTLDLSEEEYRLLEEVALLSGTVKKSEAVVRALQLYRKHKSPIEREQRRQQKEQGDFTAAVEVNPTGLEQDRSRSIPSAIRDAVLVRDQGRCTYVGPDGHRCNESRWVQLDHIQPFSCGGEHSVANLRVLCGAHNRHVFQRSHVLGQNNEGTVTQSVYGDRVAVVSPGGRAVVEL